jgi:hypothetical protein
VKALLAAYDCRVGDAVQCLLHIKDVGTRSKGARDVAIALINAAKPGDFDAVLSLVTNQRSEFLPDIAQEFLAKRDTDGLKRLFCDSVFFRDCTHRMLALLLRLYRPDASALKQILALVASDPHSRR